MSVKQGKVRADQEEDNSQAQQRMTDVVGVFRVGTRLFMVVAVGLGIYISLKMTIFKKDDTAYSHAPVKTSLANITPVEIQISQARPFEEYQKILESRDLFEDPFTASQTPIAREDRNIEQKPQPQTAVNLSQEYKVVGVLVDDDPRVVIEDVKNKKTIFLSKGESTGDFTLEEIRDDKIIVRRGQQLIELIP